MASFRYNFPVRLTWLLLLLLALNLRPAGAADAPTSASFEPAPALTAKASAYSVVALDPHVQSLLMAAVNFYVNAQSFEADIDSVTHMERAAMNTDMESTFHIALQRPDSFSLIAKSGKLSGAMVSNGKTLLTYVSRFKKYTSVDASANLLEYPDPINLTFVEGGSSLGYEVFLQKDSLKAFEARLVKSEYIGPDKIKDQPAQHVRLVAQNAVTDYWIADGAQPVLLQAQITPNLSGGIKGISEKVPLGMELTKLVRTSTYTNWRTDQPVDAANFQFQPPPEAELVTEFFKLPPPPLIGKMAPDFQLDDLSGKPVKLSDLHGKIVVIDFWATWCAPCIASLPLVAEATSARKAQGVVFYAINVMESAAKIRTFQKEKNIDFPVLCDSGDKVADLYQAISIPQSILIDKSGRIEAIHIGYTNGLKEELGQQLDDMIAGKSLLK